MRSNGSSKIPSPVDTGEAPRLLRKKIARAIHLAHAAGPDQCADPVAADHGSRFEAHHLFRHRDRWDAAWIAGTVVRCQHRLDFGSQRLVAAARLVQERTTVNGVAQQRGVKYPGDLLPALGRHLWVLD